MKNNSHSKVWERLGSIMLFVLVLALATAKSAAAAPLAAEESIIWPVLERMIVIAGAALLISVWQHWRERRNKDAFTNKI
ncbi:MAG: hypothetical protein GY803_22080 [Chloroflexi bacterium]|nr:hypothetical protein [Chloroflexota bacterium]